MISFFTVVQYLNTQNTPLILDVTLRSHSNTTTQRGTITLFPCHYAFACREVALHTKQGTKLFYEGGSGDTYMTIRALHGVSAYVDFIALVPVDKWTSNIVTPTFFCIRRFSRCTGRGFPRIPSTVLPAREARGVSLHDSSPANSISHAVCVLVSNTQKKFRWMTPIKSGGYYVIVHYYQHLVAKFKGKLIITTYNSAVAGKVEFSYCPSVYGCRAVVQYLDEDLEQRFAMSGNMVGAIFTSIPYHLKFWVESFTFVNPDDYSPSLLKVNPIHQTRRYLKKCLNTKLSHLGKNRHFCTSSTFELTLALGLSPTPCKCHPYGTTKGSYCNTYDGHCPCKQGFSGDKCDACVDGVFPNCKPKSIIT